MGVVGLTISKFRFVGGILIAPGIIKKTKKEQDDSCKKLTIPRKNYDAFSYHDVAY